MKKIRLLLVFISLITVLTFQAFAVEAATIGTEEIIAIPGEQISIPVEISNNPGIMGLKITVKYDNSVFYSPSVVQGKLTESGLFNDSITEATSGSFDVLWSDSKNVMGDGILFVIQFTASEKTTAENQKINLSYSQADTFNEKWEDVKLDCQSITVTFANSKENIANQNTKIDDELNTTVTKGFLQSVYESTDSDKIIQAVDQSLDEIGEKRISDIPENKKGEFIKSVEEKLKESGADFQAGQADNLETLKEINELYQNAKKKDGVKVVTPSEKRRMALVMIIVAGLLIFTAATLIIIKVKKGRKNDEESK